MALALYRKYRPATFAEVVGQDHVTQPLRTALAAGRINHAYLFSGPRGCGKTSSARIMARSLNCVEGPTPDPCGVCPSCIALAPEGPGSLDVVELDAASHGGVDDTRDLRDRAFYMPAESRYRVFIIDEAHMVSTAGFNSLLKIVEEPPEHLVFIFATTEPEKVMTTIRSRTHHYPFRLIPPATLRKLLEKLCAEEQVAVEQAVFPLVIRAGGGSARDSLSILDQLLAGAGPDGVTYRHAVALLGVTDAALLDETVDALAADDGASVFGAIDKVVEAGHDPRRFAADLLQRFRDLVILAAVPDAGSKGLIDAPEDQLAAMYGQSERLGAGTLTRLAEVLHTGLTEMRGTTAPRLALELLCARMLLPSASGGEGALVQRLERLEQAIAGGVPLAAPAAAGAARQAPAMVNPPSSAPPAPAVSERAAAAAAVAPAAPSPSAAEAAVDEPVAKPAATRGSSAYRRPSLRSGTDAPVDTTASAAPPAARPVRTVNPELGLPAAPVLSSRKRGAKPAAQQPPADDWLPPDAPPDEEEYGDPVPDSPGSEPIAAAQAPGGRDGSAVAESAGSAPADAHERESAGGVDRPADTRVVAGPAQQAPADAGNVRPSADANPPATGSVGNAQRAAASSDGSLAGSVPAAASAADASGSGAAQTGGTALEQPPAPVDQPAPGGELGVTDARRLWPEILAAVQRRKRVTQAMLVAATVVDLKAGVLYLSFAVPSMAKRVMEPANVGPLREALKEVLGVDWAIRSDPAADGAPAIRPNLSLVPSPPADSDDEAPDDYDVRVAEPPGPRAVVRDPEEAAIELLTQELGAKRLET